MRVLVILACALTLQGCVGLLALGGLGAGSGLGLGGSIVSGAGEVIGGEAARAEIAWLRAQQKCNRAYRLPRNRKACMDVWRQTH